MNSSSLVLALAILGSSFWGSWHCAGMCGPIASLMAHKKSLPQYLIGKMISYVSLGFLSGALGSVLLSSQIYWVRIVSGIFFAVILLYWGVQALRGKKITPVHFVMRGRFSSSGFLMGASSIFLPCGWLYTYVLAAAATQSAAVGVLTMFLFWLGSVPSLTLIPVYVQKSLKMADSKKRKIGGMILIGASLYSIGSFYFL